MGSEREAAAFKRPKCPVCNYPDAARLAPSDTVDRWQCRSLDCMHQWTTPRERLSVSAMLKQREEEVIEMATSDLRCGKCGREFVHRKRRENHEASCGGEKAVTPRARRSPPPKALAATVTVGGQTATMALIPVTTKVPAHLVGTVLEPALSQLLDRKKQLEEELRQVGTSIETVAKLEPPQVAS